MVVHSLELKPLDIHVSENVRVKLYEVVDQDEALDVALQNDCDPFGALVWPSAIAATTTLIEQGSLTGIHVLDLGSGPGLTAFTAAQLGAVVTATDISPVALQLLRTGATHCPNVTVQKLDISDSDAVLAIAQRHKLPCLIVATDLLYECTTARKLARAIALCYDRCNVTAIVCDPGRHDGRNAFLNTLFQESASLRRDTHQIFENIAVRSDLAQIFRLSTPPTTALSDATREKGFIPPPVGIFRLGTLPHQDI